MWNRLIDIGRPGETVLTAWIAKEQLRTLLALARTRPLRYEIFDRLHAFASGCADITFPDLHGFVATVALQLALRPRNLQVSAIGASGTLKRWLPLSDPHVHSTGLAQIHPRS